MTLQESRNADLWKATYAAAFVSEVSRVYADCHSIDDALEVHHAERACHIADTAVAQLVDWMTVGRGGGRSAG